MVLSRIWAAFILIASFVALGKFIFEPGEKQVFSRMVTGKSGDTTFVKNVDSAAIPAAIHAQLIAGQKTAAWDANTLVKTETGYKVFRLQAANGVFETTKDAVNLSINLIGIMALFLGFMNIAEKAGGIGFLSRIIGPFFSKIFPEVPRDHPAMGHMVMNFSANLLGLDNAATPFGIKSMESLQTLNPNKEKATNAQVMFMCLHASGLTLIPTTIIADRVALKSQYPTEVFIPLMMATFAATIAALTVVSIKQKINLFQPVILGWILGITMLFSGIVLYVRTLDAKGVTLFSSSLSNGLILLIFLAIIVGAIYKRTAIFDDFIDGAKEGFTTAIKIIPYLVGLLVAISLLRNSGAFDYVMNGVKMIFAAFGGDTRIADALPTALLKPFSGSGARAMMIDTLKANGPDSFVGNLASVFRGAADTTFYIIAVYFGAVNIKNTRYSVGAMLLADLAGVITAIALSYVFFA